MEPRYDQITLDQEKLSNRFYQVISPKPGDEGVWIHQDAWFPMGRLQAGFKETYVFRDKRNGLNVFVLEGEVEGQALQARDGFGLWDVDKVNIAANSDPRVLLVEVPMNMN